MLDQESEILLGLQGRMSSWAEENPKLCEHLWSLDDTQATKVAPCDLYFPWFVPRVGGPSNTSPQNYQPPQKILKKNIFKAMVQAALLTIKRKDHIIAVINHWLRFIIAIIPSKFIVTAVNDQFIRALTILGNGLSRLMWVTTNFSRIIA